ncbi:MAG: response regulator [Alphaproteobacteria bacterium]|nr:response regulator [Alphaproteobacteria bacterium]
MTSPKRFRVLATIVLAVVVSPSVLLAQVEQLAMVELQASPETPKEAPATAKPAFDSFDAAVEAAKGAMMSSPAEALSAAEVALVFADEMPDSLAKSDAVATSFWLQAEAALRLNRPTEAAPLVTRAESSIGDGASQLAGDILLTKARLARAESDFGLALISFQDAYRIFNAIDSARSQAIALQGVGTVYDAARQYERVIDYNERATAVYSDDGSLDLVSLNNRANALRELGRYREALPLLEQALQMARERQSAVLETRILTNVAMLHLQRGALDAAATSIDEALRVAMGDAAGGWRVYIHGVSAQLALERGDMGAAVAAIERTFDGADLKETPAAFRDFHETAYKIYKIREEKDLALAHLERFKSLDDQGREVAANANQAILSAEFDFANQELQIEKLQRNQLESDFALAEARQRQRLLATYAVLALVTIVLGFMGLAIHSARRNQRVTASLNAELESANVELQRNNAALEKANQAKLQFLSTTSHEIRTPLNAIIGLTDVIMAGDSMTPRDKEYVRIVNESGKSLLAIVNDILDISRLESGRLVIDAKPVDVADSIGAVAELWRRSAEDKDLEFEVDIAAFDAPIATDDRLLRQIASNLISNAVKFTKSGAVRVSLRPWTSLGRRGLELCVADTGIGIAPEARDLIFEAFRQEDGSARRNFGGAGLGLAIVQRLVHEMDGEISLDSALGEGSVFTIRLPARADEIESATAPRELPRLEEGAAPCSIEELDVLLVEDNPANAMVIKALLKSKVKSIETAENGEVCLRMMEENSYDLILMDKQMPVMDGLEAIRCIRKMDDARRDVAIIAVTADVFPGAREELIEAGADDYVSKPVQLPVILRTIDATLARRARSAGDDGRALSAAS